MAANYKMVENPPKSKKGKKVMLHPRIVPWGTLNVEDLIKEGKGRSTFTAADLKGAMRLISDLVAEKLSDGYTVYLDNVGYLSVSLKSRPVENKSEIRSESVHFGNVNFRCCAKLKHALKTMPLVRYKEGKRTLLPPDDKEYRLMQYMDSHPFITSSTYRALTGATAYAAQKDLKQLVADGKLSEEGTRRMRIYIRPTAPDADRPDSLVVESNIAL